MADGDGDGDEDDEDDEDDEQHRCDDGDGDWDGTWGSLDRRVGCATGAGSGPACLIWTAVAGLSPGQLVAMSMHARSGLSLLAGRYDVQMRRRCGVDCPPALAVCVAAAAALVVHGRWREHV